MAPLTKPLRGTALIEKRQRTAANKKHEQQAMHAALVRDKYTCRNPQCATTKAERLPVDPMHFIRHRGIGGNPAGDRTARRLILAGCRRCHGLLDAGLLAAHAVDAELLADGPVEWSASTGTGWTFLGRT